ncbi:MAG: M23 family metallopeptidase [Acidobacteriia bacterium]|nr:M23 family metallopeptidase [Terriglobia bacterium]
MSRKFYTIFILPHAHARFRKIHVSRNFLLILAGIVALAVAAGATTPHLFLAIRARTQAIASLQEENRKLKAVNGRFEASLAQLGAQLDAFDAGVRRLASAVGLKDLPTFRRSSGGATVVSPETANGNAMLDGEIEALRTRAITLDSSLDQLNRKWEERLRVLASTPNGLPVAGSYSDGFGWRKDPFSGEPEFHTGLDVVAPIGTAVRATADGVVTRVGTDSGYGRMVQLSHGYGLGTLYGHLSATLVRPGARVRRGDVIGRVGTTGRSTGPHVHYEVVKGGHRVDPRKYTSDSHF